VQTLYKQADRTRGEEMNDLRKAAEMAWKPLKKYMKAMAALKKTT
jgi:hypothetical protein